MKKRTLSVLRMLLALLIAAAPPLAAQNPASPAPPPTASTGKGQIVGVVVDSLDGKFLSGADVVIRGGEPAAHTDSLGKISIDSLVPGTYQVGVFHDLLDTLGITLLTRPFRVGPDSTMAVDSRHTIGGDTRAPFVSRSGGTTASAVIGQSAIPKRFDRSRAPKYRWRGPSSRSRKGSECGGLHDWSATRPRRRRFHHLRIPNSMQASLQARRGAAVSGEDPHRARR